MQATAKRFARIGWIVVATSVGFFSARESAAEGAGDGKVQAELRELHAEYDRLNRARIAAVPPDGHDESDSNLSDEEWLKQGRELESKSVDPNLILLPRFLTLARAHPESPFALDALAYVIQRGGPQTGDVLGEPWRLKELAIDEAALHHMDDPRIVHVFDILSGSLPSRKTEAFLRRSFESSPNRATRAAAGLSLARYFRYLGKAWARTKQQKSKIRVANNQRFWKIVVTPYLEQQFPYDDAEMSAEMDRLLTHVIEDYADVVAVDWNWSGPERGFLQTAAYLQPRTYADLAAALRFELKNIVPGKTAPDIAGSDAQGQTFRLSDYRGKVVLLTFSADWCGSCVKLYPLQRKLVGKFRDQPFALVSVSRDETAETLRNSLASGDITWRCWWDGLHGPITEAWNISGAPTLFLLDHEGVIQDVPLTQATSQEDFEQAISSLLAIIPAVSEPAGSK